MARSSQRRLRNQAFKPNAQLVTIPRRKQEARQDQVAVQVAGVLDAGRQVSVSECQRVHDQFLCVACCLVNNKDTQSRQDLPADGQLAGAWLGSGATAGYQGDALAGTFCFLSDPDLPINCLTYAYVYLGAIQISHPSQTDNCLIGGHLPHRPRKQRMQLIYPNSALFSSPRNPY